MTENSSIYQITRSVQIIFADNIVNDSLCCCLFSSSTRQTAGDTGSEILSSLFLHEPERVSQRTLEVEVCQVGKVKDALLFSVFHSAQMVEAGAPHPQPDSVTYECH